MTLAQIEQKLYQRAEQVAHEQSRSIGDILNAALQSYLWELDRRKITEESAHYRRQHAQLRQEYLGEYIAMHRGAVVDHSEDFTQLRQRMQERFPNTAVMITLVTEEPIAALARSGFRMADNPQ